jgi:hypothetical protein
MPIQVVSRPECTHRSTCDGVRSATIPSVESHSVPACRSMSATWAPRIPVRGSLAQPSDATKLRAQRTTLTLPERSDP